MTQEQAHNKMVRAFGDLVGLFETKRRSAIMVTLILAVLYLFVENRVLNNARIEDKEEWKNESIRDMRASFDREIKLIKESQRQNSEKIDSTANTIKPVIENVNKTLKHLNSK